MTAVGFACALSLSSGCGPRPQPNVIVILIDALRADHLGCYGYDRDTSPNIDALAAESLLFSETFAQSPWTKPSIPTLFTSLYPIQHGVYEGEARTDSGELLSDVLAESYSTFAEVFQANGYDTVGLVHNAHLAPDQGVAQGFEQYEQASMDALEINRRFFEYLDRDREEPFFAYLHYLDVHWPFQPEEPFRGQFRRTEGESVFDRLSWRGLRDRINDGTLQLSGRDVSDLTARYDAGIAQLDHQIGRLLSGLRERALLERSVLVFTSDHGEELLDHGEVGHGGTLYREVVEIPLLIRLPGRSRVGRLPGTARLIDVFPTLLGAAGIEAPPGLEGRDLLAAAGPASEIVAETRHKRTYRASLQSDGWKYIRTYRLRRVARPDSSMPASFGLAPGMRVKARGVFEADGRLFADKISLKDSGDDDLEISGRIEFVRPMEKLFAVQGFRVDGEDLVTADGDPLVPRLVDGMWVKVEGKAGEGRTLRADHLERLAEDDHDDEIEGVIERLDEHMRLRIGGVAVIVTDDTRIKGLPPRTQTPAPGSSDTPDPFAASRLLSSDAPPFEEQLFDLSSDPDEQIDVASREPERVSALSDVFEGWLRRMSLHRGARVDRQSLDASTIENLRVLGYVE